MNQITIPLLTPKYVTAELDNLSEMPKNKLLRTFVCCVVLLLLTSTQTRRTALSAILFCFYWFIKQSIISHQIRFMHSNDITHHTSSITETAPSTSSTVTLTSVTSTCTCNFFQPQCNLTSTQYNLTSNTHCNLTLNTQSCIST